MSLGSDGAIQTSRILTSQQAESLLFAIMTYLAFSISKNRWILPILSAFVILLSQQRTVWVSSIFIVAFAIIASKNRSRNLVFMTTIATVCATLVLAYASPLIQTLNVSTTSTGTFSARTDSWAQVVQPAIDKGLFSVLFGSPFGSGFLRFLENGNYATYNPHNFYIFLFVRIGAIGLTVYLVAILSALAKSIGVGSHWTTLVIIGVAVYGFTYNIEFAQSMILAIAIRYSKGFRTQPRLKLSVLRLV